MSEFDIRKLSPEIMDDFFDFFDNRAFSDGSPFGPCYCNAYNMSKERIHKDLFERAKEFGGGSEGWHRAIRTSAEQMILDGELKGYLAFDDGIAVGWCNANDRANYYRVGEFDLSEIPDDIGFDNCSRGEIKSIVCYIISPDHRGRGMATALLQKVIDDATEDGYLYVETYPMIGGGYAGMAYTGPVSMYEKRGFFVHEQHGEACVMRKRLR